MNEGDTMSDPMNRNDPPLRDGAPPPASPPPSEPAKGSPLIWILVLVALLALAWYFLSQRDTEPMPSEPTAPIGQVEEAPAATERTTPRRQQDPAQSRQPARPVVADRDAAVSNSVEPEYPIAAARARDEGTVLVRAQVGTDGKPTDVTVARSSRSRDLDRAAVDAVRQWTFEPAIREGKSVASSVQVPVQFTLDER